MKDQYGYYYGAYVAETTENAAKPIDFMAYNDGCFYIGSAVVLTFYAYPAIIEGTAFAAGYSGAPTPVAITLTPGGAGTYRLPPELAGMAAFKIVGASQVTVQLFLKRT